MNNFLFVTVLVILAHIFPADSDNRAIPDSNLIMSQHVRILFWNVENLFDYHDDTTTIDEAFTGAGAMHWTYSKLRRKLAHVAKTILAAGAWNPPGIIGLCEIENRYVLNRLVYDSPLKPFHYRIIHRNSPDRRGIDVAILYRETIFNPTYSEWISIRFPFDTIVKTRDILYVKGVFHHTDTIHLFVNHWPSRRGGEKVSAPKRNYVASVLRIKVDSILRAPTEYGIRDTGYTNHESRIANPYILIMGDFNDEPDNESLRTILRAGHPDTTENPSGLVNLMYPKLHLEGSHKFRDHWGLLDQFIISGSLIMGKTNLRIDPGSVTIYKPDFLMKDDLKYLGNKPNRTFLGPRYLGGFSDHLPIYLDIKIIGDSHLGKREIRKYGNTEIRKCGNTEMRKYGNAEIRNRRSDR